MITIAELPDNLRSILLLDFFCLLLLHIATLEYFMNRKSLCSVKSVLLGLSTVGVFTLLVWLVQGNDALAHGKQPDFAWLLKLPVTVAVLYLSVFSIVICLMFFNEYKWQKNNITFLSIKESMDHLPTGLCFSKPNGVVLMANHKMNTLCHRIVGVELQNAENFWRILSDRNELNGIERISCGKTPVLRLSDGTVSTFQRKMITVDGEPVVQITGTDTTELQQLSDKLKQQNIELKKMNVRLRNYGESIDELTRKQEWLDTKMRIHGELGQALLATRRLLAKPDSTESEAKTLLMQWSRNIAVLRQRVVPEKNDNVLNEMYEVAESAGIKIILAGKFPTDRKAKTLLVSVAAEALTNAVKYADADKLNIHITEYETYYTAEFTNNGKKPEKTITEGGGLGTLRKRIENTGGTMSISSQPRFILTVTISKRGGEEL